MWGMKIKCINCNNNYKKKFRLTYFKLKTILNYKILCKLILLRINYNKITRY